MTATIHDWSLPTEEEEAQELASVGLVVEPKDASQEQRDALASHYLRMLGAIDHEIASRNVAQKYELDLVRARYDRILAPLKERRSFLESTVLQIAEITKDAGGYGKKAKSRAVAFGRYGCRQRPAKLEIVDAAALLHWARAYAHKIVRAIAAVPLEYASKVFPAEVLAEARMEVQKSLLNEYHAETGEIPPGTRDVPATTEYYAEPAADPGDPEPGTDGLAF